MKKPYIPDCMLDNTSSAARVARSRPAKPNVPSNANKVAASNTSKLGRSIINTPTKPIQIAVQRCQPTFSPKKIAAPITTIRGVACKIAEALYRGVSTIARV